MVIYQISKLEMMIILMSLSSFINRIPILLGPLQDCSTNGSSVNELKLQKGQRQKLAHGDVLSLTKPAEASLVGSPSLYHMPKDGFLPSRLSYCHSHCMLLHVCTLLNQHLIS